MFNFLFEFLCLSGSLILSLLQKPIMLLGFRQFCFFVGGHFKVGSVFKPLFFALGLSPISTAQAEAWGLSCFIHNIREPLFQVSLSPVLFSQSLAPGFTSPSPLPPMVGVFCLFYFPLRALSLSTVSQFL